MHTPDARWDAALDVVGAHRGDRFGVFADLVARHEEPGRRHHDFDHASGVVDVVLGLHSAGDDWAVAVLAGWFHDAVHDPRAESGVNEGASAVVAHDALAGLGATLTSIGSVCRLVCLTASHAPGPTDRSGAVLCDADLSILGADEERYERYTADVRAEYAHVSDDDWRVGRRAVLRSFLDRRTIFHTEAGRARWESQARTNISSELTSLT
ncbi:MAG: HD domain-containing protein [Acidimicrobiales bacterium]